MEIADVIQILRSRSHKQVVRVNSPASESDIAAFEQQLNLKLPKEICEFYLFANGFETEDLLFRIIPLAEILERKKEYSQNEFYLAEYLIYSDVWTIKVEPSTGRYAIYNSDHSNRERMSLTNSLPEFISRFLIYGLFQEYRLYDWVNAEKVDDTTMHE